MAHNQTSNPRYEAQIRRGPVAQRPSAATTARRPILWLDTDTNTLSIVSGSAWVNVNNGAQVLTEESDPAAPAANKVVLYAKDNGSGKTQIVARFPTGAVQVIATEP